MSQLNYKPDATFKKYLNMAVVAEAAAIEEFKKWGHDFAFFDKGAGSNAIFHDPALKKKRQADLRCTRCSQKLEVRSKRNLLFAMSHSPARPFDKELAPEDWVTFVKIGKAPASDSWEIESNFYTVAVAELTAKRHRTYMPDRKLMSQGSESYLVWPSALSIKSGTITQAEGTKVTLEVDGKPIRTTVTTRRMPMNLYVEPGDRVEARQSLLAGVLDLLEDSSLLCPRPS